MPIKPSRLSCRTWSIGLSSLFTVPTTDRGAIHDKYRMATNQESNNPNGFIGLSLTHGPGRLSNGLIGNSLEGPRPADWYCSRKYPPESGIPSSRNCRPDL